jgi:hypothetical protein
MGGSVQFPGTAEGLAKAYAAELRSTLSNSQLPRATATAIDLETGNVFRGVSGGGRVLALNGIPPDLLARMPIEGLERWAVDNCAEFRAVNDALNAGAKIENLQVHNVYTKTGNLFHRCNNSRVTTSGAFVTSDLLW